MNITTSNRINGIQIIIGIGGLFLGSLVYLIDRPQNLTYFVHISPIKINVHSILPAPFSLLGNFFPDFIHVFSFILITAGIVCCGRRGYLIICLSWFLMDSAFELGQRFSWLSLQIIPGWLKGIPFFENTENYFLHGTFDLADLAAISLGAIAAYFVLIVTDIKGKLI